MKVFYPVTRFCAILTLAILGIIPNHPQFTDCPVILYPLEDLCCSTRRGRFKIRKVYLPPKPLSRLRAFIIVYFSTCYVHFYRCGLIMLLVFFSPLRYSWALAGAMSFCLSSLGSVLKFIVCCSQSERFKKVVGICDTTIRVVYGICLAVLLYVIGKGCVLNAFDYFPKLASSINSSSFGIIEHSMFLLFLSAPSTRVTSEANNAFHINFFKEGVLKIEENESLYRITIGGMSWTFPRSNTFNCIFFAVLIYTADQLSGEKVICLQELARALGFRHYNYFSNFVRKYHQNGNSLGVLFPDALMPYLSRIRKKALKIWLEDLNLNIQAIRERLRQEGLHVSTEKLQEALRTADFIKIREILLKRRAAEVRPHVQVEENEQGYDVGLDNLHWHVDRDNWFGLIALMYTLNRARDVNGKHVATIEKLSAMIGLKSMQHLHQFFVKYETIAQRYQSLQFVGRKSEENEKLRKIVLDIWLADLTLSAEKIAAQLVEMGYVEKISASTIYQLVRRVDFMLIRRQIRKEYRRGEYRKSTRWLMRRYQQIINHLLQQLAQGQRWDKAEIEKFRAQTPSALGLNEPPLTEQKHSNLAWLRCFLFNLPKKFDGRVCCCECGSFETSRKSSIPTPHLVNDPKSGKNIIVHTFRFYCKNDQCSVGSFSATEDGSHVFDEQRWAKSCIMLRLIMLGCSYRGVAQLLGVSKSTVFEQLSALSLTARDWAQILGVIRFSGTLCIDEKFVKVAELKKTKGNRPFAYLFFAVDPLTYDLLHVEIYPSRDSESVQAFLMDLKVQGIVPEVIMTDLFVGYDSAIRKVFGRSVTISKCHFHFKKNIFKHMYEQFGKKNVPDIAEQLKGDIFLVVDFKSKKSIRYWYDELQKLKPEYLRREPRLLPMFKCLEAYLPDLLRVIEHEKVRICTNNAAEQVIRHFNQRYKVMSGCGTLETARRHAKLFQLTYRFTPFSQDAAVDLRGKTPLQVAGYEIEQMPLFQYLTVPLLFNLQPAESLALWKRHVA